jgi:hypothetical protein
MVGQPRPQTYHVANKKPPQMQGRSQERERENLDVKR